jgi:hypothetical protein
MSTTPITDPRHIAPNERLVHGLPRDNADIAEHAFAITQELILPVEKESALKAAEEKLTQKSWSDRVEWTELGQLTTDIKSTTSSGDGSASTTTRTITIGGNTSITEARNKGFFNLQAAFERGLKTEFEEEKDVERELLHSAHAIAKEALAALLPPQAFLFVPPDELFKAQQDAEKTAREFAKECLNAHKSPDKDAMKTGKSMDLKASLGKKLRSFSLRHNASMHIHPFSGQYAPETGIATVAVIESRHQSIAGEHGRVRMSTS